MLLPSQRPLSNKGRHYLIAQLSMAFLRESRHKFSRYERSGTKKKRTGILTAVSLVFPLLSSLLPCSPLNPASYPGRNRQPRRRTRQPRPVVQVDSVVSDREPRLHHLDLVPSPPPPLRVEGEDHPHGPRGVQIVSTVVGAKTVGSEEEAGPNEHKSSSSSPLLPSRSFPVSSSLRQSSSDLINPSLKSSLQLSMLAHPSILRTPTTGPLLESASQPTASPSRPGGGSESQGSGGALSRRSSGGTA